MTTPISLRVGATGSRRRNVGFIYPLLSVIVLYGDMTKRFMNGTVALAIIYGASALLALLLASRGEDIKRAWIESRAFPPARQALMRQMQDEAPADDIIYLGLVWLIALYALQMFSSLPLVEFLRSLTGFLYIALPAFFAAVLCKRARYMDLRGLFKVFVILTIPIHAVGAVQYFVDPNFLVSTEYHASGGVTARNYLEGGSYLRLPSLFASDYRYAATSAFEVVLGAMFLLSNDPGRKESKALPYAAIALGLMGLVAAGGRQRVIIIAASLLMVLPFWLKGKSRRIGPMAFLAVTGFMFACAVALLAHGTGVLSDAAILNDVPLLKMSAETIETGDVERRLADALSYSLIRETTTFFGEGLGSLTALGTPGEFGIRSLWIESGVVWGALTMLVFLLILFGVLGRIRIALGWEQFGQALGLCFVLVSISTAMLVGLSAFFEIANALPAFVLLFAPPWSERGPGKATA